MGKTPLTEAQVRAEIRKVVDESSLRKTAKEYQLSPAYLSDILNERRDVSEYVAGLFGFDKEVTTVVKFWRQ
jgi:hypothetical protein